MKKNNEQQKLSPATEMALSFLCKRKPSGVPFENMEQSEYALILMDFLEKKGEKALQALAGFYCWIIDNKKGRTVTDSINETFCHDLGERDDEWTLPRSDAYLEFWTKEMVKIPQRTSV